jgi:hypothetical protein
MYRNAMMYAVSLTLLSGPVKSKCCVAVTLKERNNDQPQKVSPVSARKRAIMSDITEEGALPFWRILPNTKLVIGAKSKLVKMLNTIVFS